MPISREAFEQGQIDLTNRILALLAEDSSNAWSLSEIVRELEMVLPVSIPDEWIVLSSLFLLEMEGKIETTVVWGTDFWRAKQT